MEATAEGTLKERPAEEVAARIAQQNQEEQDIVTGKLAILKHLHIQHQTGRKHLDRADLFLYLISGSTFNNDAIHSFKLQW